MFAFSMLMAKIIQPECVDPVTPPKPQPGDGGALHGDVVEDSFCAVVAVAQVYAAQSGVVSQDWFEDLITHPAAATQVKLV